MANPDRGGYKPVRSMYGLTSWDLSLAEPYLVDDALFDTEASVICVGHPVMATVTAAVAAGQLGHLRQVVPMTDEFITGAEDAIADEAARDVIAGVVVGISRPGDFTTFNDPIGGPMAGPNDLEASSKFVLTAEVEADPDGFIIWVADAAEWIFEAQVETAGALRKGDGVDLSVADDSAAAIYNATTGRPLGGLDLNTTANAQGFITHIPRYIDNDVEAANARVWFKFNPRLVGFDGTTSGSTAADTAAS
jgi:hypothetical protein